MFGSPSPTTQQPPNVAEDLEMQVEDVAARLGLPVSMVIRRIEAGDVPARREDGPDGVRYHLRLSDLGVPAEGDDEDVETVVETPPPSAHPNHIPASLDVEDDVTRAVPPPGTVRGVVELVDAGAASTNGNGNGHSLAFTPDPRADLSAMALDPRELVAGLLDRWERVLEQRIYTEQRQRFENELTARQTQIKQLQLELQATRAQHAAELAERERRLAESELAIVERERALSDARARRRGWLLLRRP